MDEYWKQITADLPSTTQFLIGLTRLVAAGVLAGIVGLNRERLHEAAGLRTHIMVAISAALFVMLVSSDGVSTAADVSRVVQGVATGIGFVGAGAILRQGPETRIHGLTTATSIWLSAAIGVGAGVGKLWKSAIAAVLGWFVLSIIRTIERRCFNVVDANGKSIGQHE